MDDGGKAAGIVETGADDSAFTHRLCDLLYDFASNQLTLTDADVAREPDEGKRAVLTGLLMLYDELRHENERRTQAENQLRAEETKLRTLMDAAKIGILDCDIGALKAELSRHELRSNGSRLEHRPQLVRELTELLVVRSSNSEAHRMFGVDRNDDLQRRLANLPDDDAGFHCAA